MKKKKVGRVIRAWAVYNSFSEKLLSIGITRSMSEPIHSGRLYVYETELDALRASAGIGKVIEIEIRPITPKPKRRGR